MKIQCNVCESAEANVLCCADEAALCWACDDKVHAANKLASKHQRVPLSNSSSKMPLCDVCQETVGYFFCLEDRALLCRKCDVAIHTANSYVAGHRRFLLTGVKVGLDPAGPMPCSSSGKSHSFEKASERETCSLSRSSVAGASDSTRQEPHSVSRGSVPMTTDGQLSKVPSMEVDGIGGFAQTRSPFAGGSTSGSISQWQIDDFLALNDFNQNYGYVDNGSSKADNGKLGDSDGSPFSRAAEEGLDGDDCLGQVPDSSWAVPQIHSPPTASGIFWPKTYQNRSDSAVFVTDISYSPFRNLGDYQHSHRNLKRRRDI